MSDWTTVEAQQSKSVRWTKDPENKWQEENTIFIGETITGLYSSKREGVGANEATIYEIKVGDEMYSIWDTTVLADRMKAVPIPSEVEITYTGKQTPKNNPKGKPYATFTVRYRPAPMVEVKSDDSIPFVE